MSIRINDLTVRFKNGVVAVNKASLEIPKGIYGLLGENGAGKTTLMRVLTTVLKQTEGLVSLDGILYNEGNYEKIQKKIGYLPQEIDLYPNLTVKEYTSNTGSTEKYAKMLSHQICVPSYSMEEAKTKVKPGAEIIYMGWIMAGKIKGYPEAARKYRIQAVCGVGMGQTGTQLAEVRTKNKVPQRIPLFTLQGTFDIKKLHGVYKMMMNVMVKTAGKALADKSDRTPEDDDMLDMMMNGSERVKAENLKHIIEWYDTAERGEK